jgi:LPXTG-site transpeptidase (sortase) family protein
MDAPTPDTDLDSLTISDLESLLADKRRRQGQRMLRSIAGRAQPSTPPEGARVVATPQGLAGPPPADAPPTMRLTERLRAPTRSLPPLPAPASPSAAGDRFGRVRLSSPGAAQPAQGGAALRRPAAQRVIDRTLQLAEIAIVLVLLVVVGEWIYSSYVEPPDSSDLFATASLGTPGTPTRARAPGTPLTRPGVLPKPGSTLTPSPTATPLPPNGPHLAAPLGANPGPAGQSDSRPPARPGAVGVATAAPTLTPSVTPSPSATPSPAPTEDPSLRLPIRMVVPKLKLDIRVREVELQLAADQAQWEVADYMAGHHTGTANPGEMGNVVIAGHRDIRGKVFYYLDKLKEGDEIFLYTGLGVYRYIVRGSTQVAPTRTDVMNPTDDARLTLITCTPIGLATKRLIVVADLDPFYVSPDR